MTFVSSTTRYYRDQINRDNSRLVFIEWAVTRYEQVTLWPPQNFLLESSQWEIDLLWLVHIAKKRAEKEIEDETVRNIESTNRG